MRAFAMDEAVPFRVFTKILLRRHQRIKRVAEAFVFHAAPELLWDFPGLVIGAITRLPVRFETREPIGSAIFKRRLLANIQIGDFQSGLVWQVAGPGRPPADAALFLQEPVYRINSSSRPAAGQ